MSIFCIQNAYILPMVGAAIENGFVLTQDDKIQAVGPMEQLPRLEGVHQIDAQGGYVTPGLIDAHSHLGLYEDSLGFEGADGNEDTDPVTPQLRAIDGVNPMERAFQEAVAAGVTAVAVSPGSANPIGGQIAVVRAAGSTICCSKRRQG